MRRDVIRHGLAIGSLAGLTLLSATATAQEPQPPPVLAGESGFSLQSADGGVQVRLGLLLHADARFAVTDTQEQVVDTFALRRLRPVLRGRVGRRLEFTVTPDFAGGTLVVQDAYIDTILGSALRVRIGKSKTPFGLERLQSAANLLFVERALPTALVPNRDVGIQVLGDVAGGRISYMAAVMNGVADGGSGEVDTNDGKDVTGRVVVRPFARRLPTSVLRGVGLAVAASTGIQSGTAALPVHRTPSLQQPFFAFSGARGDGRRTRYSPQIFYFNRAFGGFAEYVHTELPVTSTAAAHVITQRAWQVAGSVVLTGEPATDTGVRPAAAFAADRGRWGAWQLAARIHALDVDDQARTLGLVAAASLNARAWTLGLNWFVTPNLRYIFNFERTVFEDGAENVRPAENAAVFRTQLTF